MAPMVKPDVVRKLKALADKGLVTFVYDKNGISIEIEAGPRDLIIANDGVKDLMSYTTDEVLERAAEIIDSDIYERLDLETVCDVALNNAKNTFIALKDWGPDTTDPTITNYLTLASTVVAAPATSSDTCILMVCVPHTSDDMVEYGFYVATETRNRDVLIEDAPLKDAFGAWIPDQDEPWSEVPKGIWEEIANENQQAKLPDDPIVIGLYDGVCPTPVKEDDTWIEDAEESSMTIKQSAASLSKLIKLFLLSENI